MKHRPFIPLYITVFLLSLALQSAAGDIRLKAETKNALSLTELSYQKMKMDFVLNVLTTNTVNTESGNFATLGAENFTLRSVQGQPGLPVSRNTIEIPVGATVEVKYLVTTYTEYSLSALGILHPIYPTQPPVRKSDKITPPLTWDKKYYQKNTFNDDELVTVDDQGFMRGKRIGRLSISPVRYNPKTGKIRVYEKIKFEIIFHNADIQATRDLQARTASPYFMNLDQRILTAKMSAAPESNNTQYPVSYVIVAPSSFETALQSFVAWKTKKGFKVIEAYTNDPQVGNTTTSIKNYLQNLYNQGTAENPSFSFVLLVGDVAEIPSFSGLTGSHVTDLYYAEYTGDMLPEVFIGRFSATNEFELNSQISKTLEYEQYLMPDPSYLDEVVLIAGSDNNFGPLHANGQINYGTDTYFNAAHGLVPYAYLYPQSSSYASQIIQDVSDGVGFANYTAHGSTSGWSDPSFSVSDVIGLQNAHQYPLMIGNCCLTLTFDSPLCFGEALLRADSKGAIGYIGASDYSYWDEDYYWAVGARTISANPAWSTGPLGLYDRLFHDHGESFPEWFTTQGQLVVAGNLAVTEGSPGSSDYYWEIYHLMGDPSLMPYIGVPEPITANYNSLIPLGTTAFTVNTVPYAYVAVSANGNLYGAALADSNGLCVVPMIPVTTPGYVNVVITAQNYQPYMDSVPVMTPAGPYVLMNGYAVHEIAGNNNGWLDFNEQGSLDITLKNWGQADANPVSATLSSQDPYVSISDDFESWGLITSNAEILKTAAFTFTISDNIPDQHKIPFTVDMSDGINNWISNILLTVSAPKFEVLSFSFSDSQGGNGNGVIDPGESLQFNFTVKNTGHSSAPLTIGNLNTLSSNLTLVSNVIALNTLDPGIITVATFSGTVSPAAQPGDQILLDFMLSSGQYNVLKSTQIPVGSITENWENGWLSFNWQAPGNHPWFISVDNPYEGQYCVQSGDIGNSSSTVLTLTADVLMTDSISFFYKVSSEDTYDFLKFFVNGSMKNEWSGEEGWSYASYLVEAGTSVFKWVYEKDQSEFSGQDAAWIDNIRFPAMAAIITGNQELPAQLNSLSLFPNPASTQASIVFYLEKGNTVDMRVYNALGQEVSVVLNKKELPGGTHSYAFNTTTLPKGMYYVRFLSQGNTITKKLIVE